MIDSYPTKPTMAEKIGSCEICGEGIFSDEEMWQSEKGDLYYCNKCVEESARRRLKRQSEIKKARIEFIAKELIKYVKSTLLTSNR
mgnify:FL=1